MLGSNAGCQPFTSLCLAVSLRHVLVRLVVPCRAVRKDSSAAMGTAVGKLSNILAVSTTRTRETKTKESLECGESCLRHETSVIGVRARFQHEQGRAGLRTGAHVMKSPLNVLIVLPEVLSHF